MRAEKQFLLDEIKDQINVSNSFLLVSYLGLKSNVANDFRREVAKSGGSFEVVRKRVLLKAAEEIGISLKLEQMPGHIGLVFAGEDPIDVAKTVFKFKKDNANIVKVVGAKIDNDLIDGKQTETLSKLPGKDQMRSEFLGLLEAPMAQTLSTMEALLTSVMHCLENKSKQ